MEKVIFIKLTKVSPTVGPFDVYDTLGNTIATNISKDDLILGKSFLVDDSITQLVLKSTGKCKFSVIRDLITRNKQDYNNVTLKKEIKSCLWTHLVDHTLYNSFYGNIEPYVIEYPFSYQYLDEIVQDVNEFSKVYKHNKNQYGFSDRNNKVAVDDVWFNKSVLYNDQQSTGTLILVTKPVNNMKEYISYPKHKQFSKEILWTKIDNVYNYNTFWSIVKDKNIPLFKSSCETLSIDKVINDDNMDYTIRSFRKETIRSKDLKIRHTLDNRSDISIVTQFILTPAMQSYL